MSNTASVAGRWVYLLDWMEPGNWFLSDPGQHPTRVVKQLARPPNENDQIVKVIINPSRLFDLKWSPILEIEMKTNYLDEHTVPHSYISRTQELIPSMPYEWYDSPELAKLAAFEHLWPSSTVEDWQGTTTPYYEDLDYETEYYEWAYGHPAPN